MSLRLISLEELVFCLERLGGRDLVPMMLRCAQVMNDEMTLTCFGFTSLEGNIRPPFQGKIIFNGCQGWNYLHDS